MSAALILGSLGGTFRKNVSLLIDTCAAEGVIIVPYFGLRTLADQARLWRRSRGDAAIGEAIGNLREAGANFLADVLIKVGEQPSGPWATNALPGASWHQWGEAVDFFVERNGKPSWDAADPGYETMALEAERLGLTSGKRWVHPDTDHVQLRREASPLDAGMTWAQIDEAMGRLQAAG